MGTRSLIGIENADNTVTYVYCHWNGYPEHNGQILQEHYQDRDKVLSLMAQGDLSILAPRINPEPDKPHKFHPEPAQDGVCVFYRRDRGETGVDASTAEDLHSFEGARGQCNAEYLYLFTAGGWRCKAYGGGFVPLVQAIAEDEAA